MVRVAFSYPVERRVFGIQTLNAVGRLYRWRIGLNLDLVLFLLLPLAGLVSVVVTWLKGRWWLGLVGFFGLASLFEFISEAYQNSPLHLLWVGGLSLLSVASVLKIRQGSYWDRRHAPPSPLVRRGLLIGAVVPLVFLVTGLTGIILVSWLSDGQFNEGRFPLVLFDALVLIGTAAAALSMILISGFTLRKDQPSGPVIWTSLASAGPVFMLGLFTVAVLRA